MTSDASVEIVRAALMEAAQAVVDNKDRLTKADQAIGDGDHGVGMARGYKAFREALENRLESSVPDLFKAGGQAIMMTSGGASGIVFGMLFTGAAKALSGHLFDGPGLAAALSGGLEAVCARGKAKPGEKTLVDALAPAAEAAGAAAGGEGSLLAVAMAAATAAERGLDATKGMVATTGKAKAMGERSIGHVDPGALTFALFLRAFATALAAD